MSVALSRSVPLETIFHDADKNVVAYTGEPVSWRVSVYALIFREGKLLIGKSSSEELWDLPGGGVEIGEQLRSALQREAIEEVGAQITVGKLVDVVEDFFYHRGAAEKRFCQTIQIFFTGELVGELDAATDPAAEAQAWITPAELSTHPLPEAAIQALSTLGWLTGE